ncbi:ABC transporter ATP-binding protein [Romboutsia ilealis]|uniref:ABC transporter ATP-binding protein n=1 Tax=Romboutsia faecis TaxID=2764597 RepID=A0ABR7JR40_9FIRM|nr:ABC transporter ATP-binding protein [Romboutsia faecis]MBC5997374.1 ABC transporter ATP-binding protein [Romboutsia faecis]MRN23656.1 ABC transporter ATP-binding protein [Romboutsia ilealis]
MEEIILSIKNINKKYNSRIVYENFNIDFYLNKVNCIVGKSGCGKSTILNIISGIIPNDSNDFTSLESIGLSYIFQEDRLIDWLTVEENIKLVVKKHYNKEKIEELSQKYLDLVGIEEYKNNYPQMLSGGVRQRVNIARAFIYPSKVIIMDEPFKSIDIKNKMIIMDSLKEILKRESRTVLFVTHDMDEAIYLADYIFVLGNSPVQVMQIFENNEYLTKKELYEVI